MLDPNLDTEVALLRADIEQIKTMIAAQDERLEGLLEAWETANGVISFIKILGEIGNALIKIGVIVAAVWLLIKSRLLGVR